MAATSERLGGYSTPTIRSSSSVDFAHVSSLSVPFRRDLRPGGGYYDAPGQKFAGGSARVQFPRKRVTQGAVGGEMDPGPVSRHFSEGNGKNRHPPAQPTTPVDIRPALYQRIQTLPNLWRTLSVMGMDFGWEDEEEGGDVDELFDHVIDRQPMGEDVGALLLGGDMGEIQQAQAEGGDDRGYLSWLYDYLLGYPNSQQQQLQQQLDSGREQHQLEEMLLTTESWEEMTLGAPSCIITLGMARKIASCLPYTLQTFNWQLAYSTYRDGTSLQTLYRMCGAASTHTANILLIKDDQGNVVGGFTTHPWRLCAAYSHTGQGESFLFNLVPEFKVHRWTGKNEYFMMAEKNCLHMGLSEGRYGLWVDDTLTRGHTDTCATFSGGALLDRQYFNIVGLEVWCIGA